MGARPSAFEITGTLPDWALKEHIKSDIIKINPLPSNWEELVDEVTIDLHLGSKLRVFTNTGLNTIDTKFTTKEEIEKMMELVELKEGQPFILTEDMFVIATTKERLTIPDDIVGHLHGKSSLARLGIVVHSTAARFDPGWDGWPVLEFGTFLHGKKVIIYESSPICAFSFEKLAYKVNRSYRNNPYSYGGSPLPIVSNISRKTPLKDDEQVLVIPAKVAVPRNWTGIKVRGLEDFPHLIKRHGTFQRRGDVEHDPNFKQIIPYMIFKYKNKYFLMQRTEDADPRLKNMFSLGIGGHINKEDLNGEQVLDWAKREFDEEIKYDGTYTAQPLGLVYDHSNEVGLVHLGYVILLEGDSKSISIKDEHRSGELVTLRELNKVYNKMESWSKLVVDYLKEKSRQQ